MDVGDSISKLILVLISIGVNGFFVAAEFALARSRISKVEANQKQKKDSYSQKLLLRALTHINDYISAAQIGITIASLIVGALAEVLFSSFFHYIFELIFHTGQSFFITIETASFILAIALATFLHVVLGEFIPKTIAIHSPEKIARMTIIPLHWFAKLTSVFVWIMNQIALAMLKPIGITSLSNGKMAYTEDEIKYLLKQSEKEGVIETSEREMVNNVFEFGETVVREIMTPRTEIQGVEDNISIQESVKYCITVKKSKIPVYHEQVDNIIGMIYVPDLLKALDDNLDNQPIEPLIKPVMRIPESKLISNLLSEFKIERTRLAIVIDEFGGTSGLVTLQDIVEEVVGDIELDDEHFIQEEDIHQVSPSEWLVRGSTPIDDINEILQSNFSNEHFDTVGGFVFGLLGREPIVGDSIRFTDWLFTITKKGRKIEQIHILKSASQSIASQEE